MKEGFEGQDPIWFRTAEKGIGWEHQESHNQDVNDKSDGGIAESFVFKVCDRGVVRSVFTGVGAQVRFDNLIRHDGSYKGQDESRSSQKVPVAGWVKGHINSRCLEGLVGNAGQEGSVVPMRRFAEKPPDTPAKAAAIPASGCRPAMAKIKAPMGITMI